MADKTIVLNRVNKGVGSFVGNIAYITMYNEALPVSKILEDYTDRYLKLSNIKKAKRVLKMKPNDLS
jgi:hypothetical protein